MEIGNVGIQLDGDGSVFESFCTVPVILSCTLRQFLIGLLSFVALFFMYSKKGKLHGRML